MLAMGPRKVARYLSIGRRASCSFSFLWRSSFELEDVSGDGAGLLNAESLGSAGAIPGDCAAGESDGSEPEWLTWIELVSRRTRCNSAHMSAACWKRSLRSFSSALLMMCSSSVG